MKCCNDYRIIVSSFVLVYLDPDLKFQTDRIKGCFEVCWLLHFVSPLLPPSCLLVSILFYFFFFFFAFWPFYLPRSVCQAACFELMQALFSVQTSRQQATDAICTQVASREVFVSSALIWNRILPLQCSGLSRSKVQMVTEKEIINVSAFLSLHASLLLFLSHMLWY